MTNLYEDLMDICETLEKELDKVNKKLDKSGGQMSAGDLDYVDKITHAIKSVKTTCAMLEAEEDGMSFDDDKRRDGMHSMARGRGRNARRDSMGRYSSRRGRSMAGDMVMELHELMEDAPEHMRGEFQRFINKVESM